VGSLSKGSPRRQKIEQGGLGPNLLINGTFDADTGWTKGTGWTISGGKARYTSGGSAANLTPVAALALVAGNSYVVSFEIDSIAAGGVTARITGTTNVDSPSAATAGSFSYTLTAPAAPTSFSMRGASSGSLLVIDNVSMKAVL
jgi:hypothetical protein